MDTFSKLVHQTLSSDNSYNIKEIAHEMAMEYDTFYARIIGRVMFKPEEIKRLLEIVQDIKLISYFLENTNYIAANKIKIPENPESSEVLDGVQELVLDAADVLKSAKTAMNDKFINPNENRDILEKMEEVERTLALLNMRLISKS